jgi:pilus assembly protein CpaC
MSGNVDATGPRSPVIRNSSLSIGRRSPITFLSAFLALSFVGSSVHEARAQGRQQSNAGQTTVETIKLEVGEQRVLPSENVRSYSEGVPGIIDVRLTGDAKSFVLVALRPGQTTLLFIMMDGGERQYRINVTDPNAKEGSGPKAVEEPKERVRARDNIRLDFYFVKLDKSYNHQIGINWPGTFGGGVLSAVYDLQSGSFTSATAVVQDQTLPGLDLAQAAGWAKLHRHAALITANGEKAKFTGGGEVNIPVTGSLTTGIHKIEFGSTIGVLPRYDNETGRLELAIDADVSDLSDDRGTGTPGRVTSTLTTLVNLELGQSLMLAGLVSASQSRTHAGLPVLSQIPILGALFGTHSEVAQDTEDVVFIVPSVLDAVAYESRSRISEALDAYKAYTGNLSDVKAYTGPVIPEPSKPPARPPAPPPPAKAKP